MRIYVSGPLQGASDLAAARAFYDQLAELIFRAGHEAYVPHHHTDPELSRSLSSESVFNRDLAALSSCDAVIAHIGLPSTGVGAELAIATTSGRPVLGVKRPGEKSSRFAEGLITEAGGHVCIFESDSDLAVLIERWSADAASAGSTSRPLTSPRTRALIR